MEDKILKLVDKCDVVSFDVFDTLLFRNIYKPTDLFKILEKEFNIENLENIRKESEIKSRVSENNGETNYDLIYKEMENKISDKTIIEKIKNRELELEEEFLVINPFMKKIYDYCIKKNKKVFFISDMYLPHNFIKKILENVGYSSFKLYVSCDNMKTKGSGDLFKYVQKENNLNYSKWLHIGDNKHSDYDIPISLGMKAFNYINIREKSKIKGEPETIEESILRGIQNNYLYNSDTKSYWEQFGVLYASPIYYGFTNWLYNLTHESKNILYFLARDGYIIQKTYDIFNKMLGTSKETKYLYSSRASYFIPMLTEDNQDYLITLILGVTSENEGYVTLRKIFNSYGLDGTKYEKYLPLFGIESLDEIVYIKNSKKFINLIKYAYSDFEKVFEKKKKILKEYLAQEKLFDNDTIEIVDVGWGGSTQHAMYQATNKKIFGYYFGTISSPYKDVRINSLGYCFDQGEPDSIYKGVFTLNVMMYEFLFTAPHGTTLKLVEKDNKIIPILDSKEEYTDKVKIFQDASLEMIRKYLMNYKYLKCLTVKTVIKSYAEMIDNRDYEDLFEFSKIYNSVSVNNIKTPYVRTYTKSDLMEKFSLFNYKELIEESKKSLWRYTYMIKGCDTKEKYDEFMKEFELNKVSTNRVLSRENAIKFIKNPQKGINILKRLLEK